MALTLSRESRPRVLLMTLAGAYDRLSIASEATAMPKLPKQQPFSCIQDMFLLGDGAEALELQYQHHEPSCSGQNLPVLSSTGAFSHPPLHLCLQYKTSCGLSPLLRRVAHRSASMPAKLKIRGSGWQMGLQIAKGGRFF